METQLQNLLRAVSAGFMKYELAVGSAAFPVSRRARSGELCAGCATIQGSPMPSQIILYLDNIWDEADSDEETFLEEVRTTFLHELGHYLGLDEDGLFDRGLD